jgi:hypothetical protein
MAIKEREIGAVIKLDEKEQQPTGKENKPEPKQSKPTKVHEAGKVPKYLQKYKAAAEEKKATQDAAKIEA